MSPNTHKNALTLTVNNPFEPGNYVQACQLFIFRRPHFFWATISKPVPQIADLYEGFCDGERQVRRFFAHPTWQDAQSEAALLLHYRASLAPETFYEMASLFPRSGGTR